MSGRHTFFIALAMSVAACAIVPENAPRTRPNILLLIADDQGFADVGYRGLASDVETPSLDRLAAAGVRFEQAYATSPICNASRAGLMTGRYQQRAGIPGVINADPKVPQHHWGLQRSETTVAEALKSQGYRTAVVGKWHLGYDPKFNPTTHGFDFFRGFVSGNIDYQSHYDRMETYDWWAAKEKVVEPGYSTHLITKHAVEFINKNKDKPFFLYVAHEAVHAPWQGPNDPPQRGPNKQTLKGKANDRKQRALKEMLTELDKGVGEIIAALQKNKIEDNTFVFFCSDNGPAGGSSGPLRGRKGSNWEGGHRVPGIASWPGKIPKGKTSRQLGITLDLMPTLLDFAGALDSHEGNLDGISLKPFLLDPNRNSPRKLYWNAKAMRDNDWKLMLTGNGPKAKPQLFNLASDLGERNDLAAENANRVQSMLKELKAWKADVEKNATEQK